ncbi:MAG TPA: hypothetical protein VGX03_13420 [Candidatus Binatia bacterium]|nr:hypothetical protein [Candidatus Binatia bacterium]
MRQALIAVFHRSSFGFLIKPPEEDRTIPASVKPLRVALVEPVAYLSDQLGRQEEAQAQAAEVLRLNPNYSLEVMRRNLPYKDPAVLERFLAVQRKAGLK